MSSKTHYFENDVWVTEKNFHCRGRDIPMSEIDDIIINFKVNTTLIAFLCFIGSFAALVHGYFNYGDWAYLWLVGLVASFGCIRYMMMNYVEIIATIKGKQEKVLITSMRNRKWAYEVEEFVRLELENAHKSVE